MTNQEKPTQEATHHLQDSCRLSESLIWKWQRQFYEQEGVAAWGQGPVPLYVTNNPLISRAMCRVALGYLGDLRQAGALEQSSPIYVIELGAGSGRFGFHFLNELKDCQASGPLAGLKIKYVMADLAEKNISFWQQQPQLINYVSQGLLDFARFDAENDSELKLLSSGETIGRQYQGNPLIVIGNYIFDTLVTDAFRVSNGQLYQCYLSLDAQTKEGEELPQDAASILASLKYQYEQVPVNEPADVYTNADWNTLLDRYRSSLPDTGFTLPVGGFRFYENLRKIAHDRLLLLISDKAYTSQSELAGIDDPIPVLHGSFSLTVNFHALGGLCQLNGGKYYSSPERLTMLDHAAILLDAKLPHPYNLLQAFRDFLCGFSPTDFVALKSTLEQAISAPDLETSLRLLRLSNYDPEAFLALAQPFLTSMDADKVAFYRAELVEAVGHVEHNCYHIPGEQDVYFELGRAAYRLDMYEQAVAWYLRSVELFGGHKTTYHNIGLTYYYDRQLEKALEYFERALELDNEYEPALEWRAKVEKQLDKAKAQQRSTCVSV